jgi:hypothetical protein
MGNWKTGEVDAFINDFLRQQLLDLRQSLTCSKFGYVYNSALSFAITSAPASIATNVPMSSHADNIHHTSVGAPSVRRPLSVTIDSELNKFSGLPIPSPDKYGAYT